MFVDIELGDGDLVDLCERLGDLFDFDDGDEAALEGTDDGGDEGQEAEAAREEAEDDDEEDDEEDEEPDSEEEREDVFDEDQELGGIGAELAPSWRRHLCFWWPKYWACFA